MKKIALVLIAIVLVSSAAFSQGMAKSGQWGVQTALGAGGITSNTIGFKFMASENLAVRLEAGFNSFSPGGGAPSNSAYGFGAGFEYHMTAVGSVSPYVGLGAGYSGLSIGGAVNNPSWFDVKGYWGGEYFFSSNFSWAGQVGLDFVSFSPGGGGNSQTTIGTNGSATMIATWYLN